MPSLESILGAAPAGFAVSSKLLNKLFSEKPEQNGVKVDEIILTTSYSLASSSSPAFKETSLSSYGPVYNEYKSEIQALIFIFRAIAQSELLATSNISNDSLSANTSKVAIALDTFTFLNRNSIQVIVSFLTDTVNQQGLKAISVQYKRLEKFRWKLGVALSASQCKSLMSPYVAVAFDLVDPSGSKSTHSFELTYSEFQEFRQGFANIASSMSRY